MAVALVNQSIVSTVLVELRPELEQHFHYPRLLTILLAAERITKEEKANVEACVTDYAKSRKLLDTLDGKPDGVLDTIWAFILDNGTIPQIQRLFFESTNRHGYRLGKNSAPTPKRRRAIPLHKWWQEKKEVVKSFLPRLDRDSIPVIQRFRDKMLLSISSSDVSPIVAHKYAIVGGGGFGKTTIAKWFADKYEEEYDHIIWIDSDGQALRNSIQALALVLAIGSATKSLKQLVLEIYDALDGMRCLFIFDNANSFDGENGLMEILPKQVTHHCLITSRSTAWGNKFEFGESIPTFHLSVFNESECHQLLTMTLGTYDEREGLELGKQLGFLPLALQTAIATIGNTTRYTIGSYLERVREENSKSLVQGKVVNEYQRSICAALSISIDQIENDQSLEEDVRMLCKTILNVAAYCVPDKIPEPLFFHLPNVKSTFKVGDAIDALVSYSLVTVDETGEDEYGIPVRRLSIHRLLQHVLMNEKMEQSTDCGGSSSLQFAKITLDCLGQKLHFENTCDHALHAWKLFATRFKDNILLVEYSFFPNKLACHWPYVNVDEMIYGLLKIFKDETVEETDFRVVTLKIRLIYDYLYDGRFVEAQTTWESLNLLVQGLNDEHPHKQQIGWHLDLLSADIHYMRVKQPKNFYKPEGMTNLEVLDQLDEEIDFETISSNNTSNSSNNSSSIESDQDDQESDLQFCVDKYRDLVAQISSANYDGIIEKSLVYYPLLTLKSDWHESQGIPFKGKVFFNYAFLLYQSKQSSFAKRTLWNLFVGTPEHLMSVQYVSFVCEFLFQKSAGQLENREEKLQFMYDVAFKCLVSQLRTTTSIAPGGTIENVSYEFWVVADPYFDNLVKEQRRYSDAVLRIRTLLDTVDWPVEQCCEFVQGVNEIVKNLIQHEKQQEAQNIATSALEKWLNASSRRIQSVCVLHDMLRLNTMYTFVLSKQNEKSSTEMILKTDKRTLGFVQARITKLFFATPRPLTLLWIPGHQFPDITFVPDFYMSDNLEKTKWIFKSKLKIAQFLVDFSLDDRNATPLSEPLVQLWDETICILLYLGKLEEAKHLWTVCFQRIDSTPMQKEALLKYFMMIGRKSIELVLQKEINHVPDEFMRELMEIGASFFDGVLQKEGGTEELEFGELTLHGHFKYAATKIVCFIKWNQLDIAIKMTSVLLASGSLHRAIEQVDWIFTAYLEILSTNYPVHLVNALQQIIEMLTELKR